MLIYQKKKKGFFASILAKHFNNPNTFPSLDLCALKNHIKLIIENPKYPFNHLIQSITLYLGFDELKYILAVEIPDTISIDSKDDYQKLLNHWSDPGCLRYFIDKNFSAEVYSSKYHSDPYLDDWFVWTKEPKDDIPEELALKDYNWVLYQK